MIVRWLKNVPFVVCFGGYLVWQNNYVVDEFLLCHPKNIIEYKIEEINI